MKNSTGKFPQFPVEAPPIIIQNWTMKPQQKQQTQEVSVTDYLMDFGELSLDEIVGQEEAISELKNFVNYVKYKPLYKQWGLKAPRGILLTGPPGTGKTASVRALAKEISDKVVLMELRYIDIASKWVDHSIEQLRAFFEIAEEQAKEKHVIIFIDEIDSMIPQRNENLHETSMKRVNVFLAWMDGGFSSIDNITVIGATNYLEGVDSAARRPGRFDKIIEFKNLNKSAIINGIKIHLSKRNLSERQIVNIDWDNIEKTITDFQLSGADLPAIVDKLIQTKVNEHIVLLKELQIINGDSDNSIDELLKNPQYWPPPITESDIISVIMNYQKTKNVIKQSATVKRIGFNVEKN